MTTQDPYEGISSLKRRDYSGYDDFVPYRNDWRYSLGFFSILMVAAIGYGYWKLSPDQTKVVQAVAKTVAMAKKPAQDSSVMVRSSHPTDVVKPATAKAPDKAKLKKAARPVQETPTALQPLVKPEPIKPVTGPPIH